MRIRKPTYRELKERLAEAEAAIAALRGEEVDAVVGEQHVLLLRLKEAEQALRESEEFSSSLLTNSPNSILVINPDTSIKYVNAAMEKLTGFSKAELVGTKAPYPWWTEETLDKIHKDFEETVFRGKGAYRLEELFQTKAGARFQVEITSTFIKSNGDPKYCLESWVDITERKRIEGSFLWEASVNEAIADLSGALILPKPIADISFTILEHAKRLTSSEFGYVSHIEPQTGYNIASTMTRDIWDICKVENKDIVFKEFRGLWGWVLTKRKPLMTNNPSKDQRSSGTPPGHVPIRRFLSVPALVDGTLVGQIALANSDHDYSERDLAVVERLAALYAIALQRKRNEEDLQGARDELEQRVEERTVELAYANKLLKQEIEERKQAEQTLRQSQEQLRHLSSQLLKVQENERKRIGVELHDTVAQSLVAIKLSLERKLMGMDEGKRPRGILLEDLISMVRRDIKEVRRIIMELRPSMLDDLGILTTVNWLCREYEMLYPKIRIEKQLKVQEAEIPEPLKIVIFRVMQEALGNATKHSKADLVKISLRRVSGKIELSVQDNGEGFDVGAVSSRSGVMKGLGISGMRERTSFSNGSFAIESAPGEGTVVRASWTC